MSALERLVRRASRLSAPERRRAERMFAAILAPAEAGLPSFESIDRTRFWNALDSATAPSFAPGLRAMVAGLDLLPLTDSRFRRRFDALSETEQVDFVSSIPDDAPYGVRQIVSTMKMLACLAYFDDEAVRALYPAVLP